MASIEDPVARARVIELDGRAALALNRVTEREAELADLRERQAQLHRRLVDEQAQRPEDRTSDELELADLLVQDPDAQLNSGALTTLRSARTQSARVIGDYEGRTAVTATALGKIDSLIADAEARLAEDRSIAAEEWRNFVLGAYEALLDELREQFRFLNDGPLGTLVALSEVRELDSVSRVISGAHPKLGVESKMVLRTFGNPIVTETLFNPDAGPGHPGSIDRASVLATFRARLCADALAPAQ